MTTDPTRLDDRYEGSKSQNILLLGVLVWSPRKQIRYTVC
jgi:hypothetical protein